MTGGKRLAILMTAAAVLPALAAVAGWLLMTGSGPDARDAGPASTVLRLPVQSLRVEPGATPETGAKATATLRFTVDYGVKGICDEQGGAGSDKVFCLCFETGIRRPEPEVTGAATCREIPGGCLAVLAGVCQKSDRADPAMLATHGGFVAGIESAAFPAAILAAPLPATGHIDVRVGPSHRGEVLSLIVGGVTWRAGAP